MSSENFGLSKTNVGKLPALAIILGVLALLVAIMAYNREPAPQNKVAASSAVPGVLDRIEQSGELHAGYGVYPPYTQEDPNTNEVSGFSVEIMQQIAKQLNVKLVWHRLNWNTMAADLKRGEFDVIADPIFQTIPRGREFAFTEPYAYFPYGIAVVNKNETRFPNFESLDTEGITIAVGKGWASETLIKSRFTKPDIQSVLTSTDLLQVFNEVLSGRADAAVADGGDASRFVKEHPDKVKALWLDSPPAFVPAGFALRFSDKDGAEFFTVALRNLKSTGMLETLAQKYDIPAVRIKGFQ
ncbi:MAG: ABC transporter substrate-binding protein [Candidatus Thiodiazotropha sp.]